MTALRPALAASAAALLLLMVAATAANAQTAEPQLATATSPGADTPTVPASPAHASVSERTSPALKDRPPPTLEERPPPALVKSPPSVPEDRPSINSRSHANANETTDATAVRSQVLLPPACWCCCCRRCCCRCCCCCCGVLRDACLHSTAPAPNDILGMQAYSALTPLRACLPPAHCLGALNRRQRWTCSRQQRHPWPRQAVSGSISPGQLHALCTPPHVNQSTRCQRAGWVENRSARHSHTVAAPPPPVLAPPPPF
jgi:hypothetical protein